MQTQTLGQHINISDIRASLTNPRKRFDSADLQDLANSIKQHGVMQPILVRPTNDAAVSMDPTGHTLYELVSGERRWRASKLAQQDTIPAIIRELDDLETLQLQIIENLQRSDLHPLEEAQGFKALLDNKDAKSWDADELAVKIGKSRSYIYGSLKLNELCTYAQDLFFEGKFGREIALLIARIPGAKLQEQAAKDIVSNELSFRRSKDYIRQNFTLDLSKAPWDKISTTLYPMAGSCFSCPKRTGNYPELFQDIDSTDVCTDTACFAAKKIAYAHDVIKTQPNVIHGEAAKEIAPYGLVGGYLRGYEKEAKACVYSLDGVQITDELIAEVNPPSHTIVDDKNNVVVIYKTSEVQSLLKEKIKEKLASGELVVNPKEPEEKPAWKIEQEAKEARQSVEDERRIHIFNRLIPKIDYFNVDTVHLLLRMAITTLSTDVSTDLQPVLDQYQFEGTEEEFFTDFQQSKQGQKELLKMLAMLLLAPGLEVHWGWETEADNENDTDYQALLSFIGNIGLDLSQFLTAELPLTPPLAAQAVESNADLAAPANNETQLSPKLQEIKDKELAKRAKKAQKQEQKESANADLNTKALTESAQTSGASDTVEVEA